MYSILICKYMLCRGITLCSIYVYINNNNMLVGNITRCVCSWLCLCVVSCSFDKLHVLDTPIAQITDSQ